MKKAWLIAGLFSLLVGCSTLPILNVEKPVPSMVNEQPMSIETVEQVILSSADKLNWTAKVVQTGLIEASIKEGDAQGVVDINYNQDTFSIQYKDSENLGYTGEVIDNTYNMWVFHLMRMIQKELDSVSEVS